MNTKLIFLKPPFMVLHPVTICFANKGAYISLIDLAHLLGKITISMRNIVVKYDLLVQKSKIPGSDVWKFRAENFVPLDRIDLIL